MLIQKIKTIRQLLKATAFLGVVCFLGPDHNLRAEEKLSQSNYQTVLRWGRPAPDSRSEEITLKLAELFKTRASKSLNFSRRNLTSLLEEALPRRLGRLFPFRTTADVPPDFFFENFAPIGFLAGELNTRVPPILSETKTADWLELRSNSPIEPLRELTPHVTLQQGLRALSLQLPWTAEIFSTPWEEKFTNAAEILEAGGVQCRQMITPSNESAKAANPSAGLAPPPHFRCSSPKGRRAPDSGIAKELPRKLGPATPGTAPISFNNQTTFPACLPAGRLQSQSLELIGDEKAGHCFLWRASLDERFHQRSLSSSLICLNSKYKSFQKTRFNNVVAVIPSVRDDQVNIIEAEDGLLTSHRLSLSTLSIKKNKISTSSGQNLRNSQFPRSRTGLYVCKSPSSTSKTLAPFTSPMISASHLEWVYLDDALYSGLRQVRPETDVAWRLRELRDGVIDAEKLNWSQLKYDHPSIISEPSFGCATYRSIDSNCSIRILQTALQISEEFLKGEFDAKQIDLQTQLSVVALVGQSLDKVTRALPDWALNEESLTLLSFFSTRAEALSKQLAKSGVAGVSIPPIGLKQIKPKYYDVNQKSQDYLALKNKIYSASDFWATLKQKPL